MTLITEPNKYRPSVLNTICKESRQLKRFGALPDGIYSKLEQASVEQLEYWAERILEAQTLGQIFE